MKRPSEKILCQGWTSRREFRNNLPCSNKAQPGKAYCKLHDPELAEERDRKRNIRIENRRAAKAFSV